MKQLCILAAAALLLAGCASDPYMPVNTAAPAMAPNATVWGMYGDWDLNRDNWVTPDEFNTRFGPVYDAWAGTDRVLSTQEMADRSWTWWDVDGDGMIDSNEWNRGVNTWRFEGLDWRTLDQWDVNRDNRISPSEYRTGFLGTWPNQTTFEREAMRDSWWGWWDADGDGRIDANEWNTQMNAGWPQR
jgi:hypothetical protein